MNNITQLIVLLHKKLAIMPGVHNLTAALAIAVLYCSNYFHNLYFHIPRAGISVNGALYGVCSTLRLFTHILLLLPLIINI